MDVHVLGVQMLRLYRADGTVTPESLLVLAKKSITEEAKSKDLVLC